MNKDSISHKKDELRRQAREQRQQLSVEQIESASRGIAKQLLKLDCWERARCVHSFLPIRSQAEIDTELITAELARRWPQLEWSTTIKDLTIHGFTPAVPAQLAEPVGGAIDVILVPLLTFDRTGQRLGYGGGYYDRLLAEHPGAIRIGLAYAGQEVSSVPIEAHDQPLDFVVTERELIKSGGSADR